MTLTVKRMKAHRKVKRSVLSKRNSATLVYSISGSYLVRGMSCYHHSRGKQVLTKATILNSDCEGLRFYELVRKHQMSRLSCQRDVIMTRCCIATSVTTMLAQLGFLNDTSLLVSLISWLSKRTSPHDHDSTV